jgi:hypothetical protein
MTWHPPQTDKFLKLKEHHLHSTFDKSIIIARTIHSTSKIEPKALYYFPCRKKDIYKLQYMKQWFALFIDQYYKTMLS